MKLTNNEIKQCLQTKTFIEMFHVLSIVLGISTRACTVADMHQALQHASRQTKVLLTCAQKKQHICNIFQFNFSCIYVVCFTLNVHAELVFVDN